MHAHFVLAHPDPGSFNAHLVRVGVQALLAEHWTVSVSDLYAINFDPCERAEHYDSRANPRRFDVQGRTAPRPPIAVRFLRLSTPSWSAWIAPTS